MVVDRGDVWYEFPYDQDGKERSQPISRRPKMTMSVRYNDQNIPLAKFGSTVGGWRSDFIDGSMMWSFKGSPIGKRVWKIISAAPVWIPPVTNAAKGHSEENWSRQVGGELRRNRSKLRVAYGLAVAYHRRYREGPDGEITLTGDQGIRTHGSVDYMSIMRRHSHGCHRLHNHVAVRLMSFVLKHRPHKRLGNQKLVVPT